ncbi:hypothetical protein E2320_006312 [Naja naja]|nr:hypothetical protein E2320_006312 [Naja naja]
MPMVGRFLAVLLLTWSMCTAALPGEENFSAQTSRNCKKKERMKRKKIYLIAPSLLSLLPASRPSGAIQSSEKPRSENASRAPKRSRRRSRGSAFRRFPGPPGRKLEEEPLMLGHSAHLSPRDRKTPCKNFFWKTFTAC